MTFDESKRDAFNRTAPGPLERIAFPAEDDGEKSLLTLIEEHRPRRSENLPVTASDDGAASSASPPDEVDEDEGYRLDHSLMRLGGNGF
jgi:hypothetical protein